tara:strand:+ start:357 stop:1556 length:1200 start_codon:yes stop_codon:yes gene_type:complete
MSELYTAQNIFINTESGFGTAGGNQLDKWKVNLNQEPLVAEDDSRFKVGITQFQMTKNFYDVNATNNALRMVVKDMDHYNDFDGIITLGKFDATNIVMLADSVKSAVKNKLNNLNKGGFALASFSTTATQTGYALTDTTGKVNASTFSNRCLNTLENTFVADSRTPFDAGASGFIKLICLQVPPESPTGVIALGLGIDQDALFNDSYILLGGKRVEVYEAEDENMLESFTVAFSNSAGTPNDTMTLTSPYPMNNTPNTLPYLYLKMEGCRNQGSSNMLTSIEEHSHEITYNTTLAKIPRITHSPRQDIEYRLDDNDLFFTILTAKVLNSFIFSICDHRGRTLDTITSQNEDGNLIANMTLRIEKVKVPFSPNRLETGPQSIAPLPRPSLGMGMPNPNYR